MSSIVTGKLRAAWEEKLRKQIDRHRQIDPCVAPRKIVELIIRQEKERQSLKLERLLASDEPGDDDEIQILMLRALIEVVLPELEVALKKLC